MPHPGRGNPRELCQPPVPPQKRGGGSHTPVLRPVTVAGAYGEVVVPGPGLTPFCAWSHGGPTLLPGLEGPITSLGYPTPAVPTPETLGLRGAGPGPEPAGWRGPRQGPAEREVRKMDPDSLPPRKSQSNTSRSHFLHIGLGGEKKSC